MVAQKVYADLLVFSRRQTCRGTQDSQNAFRIIRVKKVKLFRIITQIDKGHPSAFPIIGIG
jgi:hypothetical protein